MVMHIILVRQIMASMFRYGLPHAFPTLHSYLGHGMGMGNTMTMWSRVCTGTGMGMGLPYLGNTIPFSMVLQVCAGMPVPGCQSGE
jgi:hypothetical protein